MFYFCMSYKHYSLFPKLKSQVNFGHMQFSQLIMYITCEPFIPDQQENVFIFKRQLYGDVFSNNVQSEVIS